MQALILAAGMGKRLQKYTQNQTKCMIRIAGKTLLEHACDALKSAGIHKVILVVGYHGEELVEYARHNVADIEFEFVYNTIYDTTNNIYSLYLARDYLRRDDTVLLESDLIYEPTVIQQLVQNEQPNLAAVAKYEYWMDGTVCTLDASGNIVEFVEKKDFDYANVEQYYKTVNIYKFSKKFAAERYIPFLETYIHVYGSNQYYESVLRIIAHINKLDLVAFDIGDSKWYEIDDTKDYNIAGTMFQSEEQKLGSYESQFGGYWRFPKMYDYCYLINPYFPTGHLQEQLKYMFEALLTQYPSGMRVQRINAARIYEIDENCLLVGNGAAELINVLGRVYSGTIGVPVPAFNEYLRCFENSEKVPIVSERDNLALDKQQILDVLDKIDMLVLVNPDNPSGSFLSKEDLLDIITECQRREKMCVVDESFVDFADPDVRYTLLNQRILDQYNNLIVIKSISKSYGIPGVRLGVLATSNIELLEKIRSNLAIWNINSFAEYFLEVFPLHAQDYVRACDRLAEERVRFVECLGKFKFLKVYPSQANYLMCKVEKISSRRLANLLLDRYNILIKDLSTKRGFDGRQYIRIAIKNKEENDFLLKALAEIEKECGDMKNEI
ncbi:MAG: aminotransferase class I/II-fold pyridoxal phosphate-dependent enzyme [Acetatifactor sp.]|nr:aminotransferase class I/II-fold pyridoxal phosphate-dependent enzyme [Acetatifactor sp.]